jgi:hypothetical protein
MLACILSVLVKSFIGLSAFRGGRRRRRREIMDDLPSCRLGSHLTGLLILLVLVLLRDKQPLVDAVSKAKARYGTTIAVLKFENKELEAERGGSD